MPSAAAGSARVTASSAMRAALREAADAASAALRVSPSLRSAHAPRSRAEPSANRPSSGWRQPITTMKTGAHGTSRKATTLSLTKNALMSASARVAAAPSLALPASRAETLASIAGPPTSCSSQPPMRVSSLRRTLPSRPMTAVAPMAIRVRKTRVSREPLLITRSNTSIM